MCDGRGKFDGWCFECGVEQCKRADDSQGVRRFGGSTGRERNSYYGPAGCRLATAVTGGCCSGWGDHNVVHGPKKAQRTMPLMKEADDGGRWAVRRIMAVRRHEGRRGRPLDVLVEWEGEDSDGDLWEESWVSVTFLSKDLRQEARRLEAELFGSGSAAAAPAPSRRAARREAIRQRQERERDLQQWRARLRDRARGRVHDRD
jgi:hypothetical protein